MDLNRALSIIDSPALLHGQSDDALLHRVTEAAEFVPSDKALSPARGLHGGIRLRPAEALHQLSYVTQPRYHANLLDFYAQWALTRYVGYFDHEEAGKSTPPQLTVSEAGRRIVGNQRRVTSEEMGIAFGAVLATRWLQRTVGARVPISIVDIDADASRLPPHRPGSFGNAPVRDSNLGVQRDQDAESRGETDREGAYPTRRCLGRRTGADRPRDERHPERSNELSRARPR